MVIWNRTGMKVNFRRLVEPWQAAIERWEAKSGKALMVLVDYLRWEARVPYSGLCDFEAHRIRVGVHRKNRYPLVVGVGSPFRKAEFRLVVRSAEVLLAFLFLHEVSHLLDHLAGIPTRNKQTKADKFAVRRLLSLGILRPADILRE